MTSASLNILSIGCWCSSVTDTYCTLFDTMHFYRVKDHSIGPRLITDFEQTLLFTWALCRLLILVFPLSPSISSPKKPPAKHKLLSFHTHLHKAV